MIVVLVVVAGVDVGGVGGVFVVLYVVESVTDSVTQESGQLNEGLSKNID